MDGVGDDFVRVVQRFLPRQQDGRAGDGLGVDVPGCAGPVLGHDHDESGQGQHRTLLVLCHALVDGVVLGDDLGDHQFAAGRRRKLVIVSGRSPSLGFHTLGL